MNDYYLRIESVNMGNFVFDTGDLSTIRGGGLLLLEAPREILKQLAQKGEEPKSITSGASWGLFPFQAENDRQASKFAGDVRKELHKSQYYQHATFVVEVLPKPDAKTYVERREELLSLSRWQQMQAPSMVVPPVGTEEQRPKIERDGRVQRVTVCEFDHARPATKEVNKGEDTFAVSESVHTRREYGKDQKSKKWYEKITGLQLKYDFVNDFNQLSKAAGGKGGTRKAEGLDQKMAVIYLDGNRFGSHQSSFCTDETKQKRFDRKVREECQNKTLGTLLKEIEDWLEANEDDALKSDWLYSNKKDGKRIEKLRLETLLWGGDEFIWVVPAWNGWWFLSRFFQIVAKDWKFFDDSNLTLSSGLVFCHHDAPIQRIVCLAKKLGELAKGDRTANRLAYQVLESFDHAGMDLEAFRSSRCPAGVSPKELILNGNSMLAVIDSVKEVKAQLPKRRIHRLVEGLYEGRDVAKELKDFSRQIDAGLVEKLQKGLGKEPACWLHLLELWDFIGAEAHRKKGGA